MQKKKTYKRSTKIYTKGGDNLQNNPLFLWIVLQVQVLSYNLNIFLMAWW